MHEQLSSGKDTYTSIFVQIFIYVLTLGVGELATIALMRLHGCLKRLE